MKIEHEEPAVRQEMTVVRADGTEQKVAFECRTDRAANRFNQQPIGGGARWVDDELLIESVMSAEMTVRDWWGLSGDGTTLTMEHRDDALAGQVIVLVKVG